MSDSVIGSLTDPPAGPAQPGRARRPRDWGTISLDTAIGAVVLFIVAAATMGGVQTAVTFLVYAIICTLGISLAILLPLAWAVGTVIRRPIAHLARVAFRGRGA
jgi:hypothetical protein